jgi:hypothetical protein
VTFDPKAKDVSQLELSRFELSTTLQDMEKIPVLGVAREDPVYSAYPYVDCSNATTMLPVILIKSGNITQAVLQGNCVVLESVENSAIALKDRVLYGVLGVI